MPLIAMPMDKDELLRTLQTIYLLVESGDCREGFIEFGPGVDVGNPESAKDLVVKAIYKTNSAGMSMIGDPEL